MADTMDIPREEVLLGRCCECGIGLDPRTHPTMTCVNCLQARVLIAASRGLPAALRHRRDSSPGEEVVGGLFFDFERISGEIATRYITHRRTSRKASARMGNCLNVGGVKGTAAVLLLTLRVNRSRGS